MKTIGEEFADAARGFAGSPFRLGGRDPRYGIDCVGLVVCSLWEIGCNASYPSGYRIRNSSIGQHLGLAEANGFQLAGTTEVAGDLILFAPGMGHHHLAISSGDGRHIHAHAGLRRTVITAVPADWPKLRHWRLTRTRKDLE
ncbi:hypothetical protein BPTFM16_01959 [Altererythrobacter insulae]|nr:hypothetical protein BPTFM16_01959 [Altererythrobacter insulae]